jgi:PAS domain S-box-containing protein
MDDKTSYEALVQRLNELEYAYAERKQMEEALREREQSYRTLSEKSLAGIYVVQDGVFRSVNANAASYAGYAREELIGKKSDSIVHPEDRLRVKRNAREMLSGIRTAPHDFRIVTKQGKIRWIMETVTAISFHGKPAILGNAMDITERKRAEAMIQESENLYRTIFENTGTATIIIEEDTTVSLVNTEFEKLSGYIKEEWEGKRSWTEFAVKEDVDRMKEYHYIRRTNPDAAPRNYEFGFIDSWGRVRDVFLTVALIPGTRKSVASIADITERKRAEEMLQESGTLYRTIFENTGTATIIIEEDTRISLVNTEFEKLSGYIKEEWEGKRSWTEFVVKEDVDRMKEYHNVRRIDPNAAPRNYEFGFIDSWGRVRDVFLTVALIPGTRKSVASFADMTERKQALRKLRESENWYRTIFETTGTATIIIEEDTTVSLVNTEFEKLSGYKKEEWEGKRSWTEIIAKKDVERMKEYHCLRRINPNAAPRNYEFSLIDRAGNDKEILLTISMIPGTTKSVASLLDITERKLAEEEVKEREREVHVKSHNLEEVNTALKVLLKRREEDKNELEEKVLLNVRELAMPYVEKLKKGGLSDGQKTYLSILEKSLNDIISPFIHTMTIKYSKLTPREIQVANLVKEGKTSKEIGELMNMSLRAVDFHRGNIRGKLGLKSKKGNLQSFLLSHS